MDDDASPEAGSCLGSLVSQALVAFTIEVDNEFEREIAERGWPGMRTSFVMWAGIMRHVGSDGLSLVELARQSGLTVDAVKFAVGGLTRWGYLHELDRDVLQPTAAGSDALEVWGALPRRVEQRWRSRFDDDLVDLVASGLDSLTRNSDRGLPDYLPAFGLPASDRERIEYDSSLFASLAATMVAVTLEHDGQCASPRGLTANTLRVLAEERDRPMRDIPGACGLARETVQNLIAHAEAEGLVAIAASDRGRGMTVRLTTTGSRRRLSSAHFDAEIDEAWRRTRGTLVDEIATALADMLSREDDHGSLLGRGLTPTPTGWRAQSPYKSHTKRLVANPAEALPHHPMPVRQGGWPDGA